MGKSSISMGHVYHGYVKMSILTSQWDLRPAPMGAPGYPQNGGAPWDRIPRIPAAAPWRWRPPNAPAPPAPRSWQWSPAAWRIRG